MTHGAFTTLPSSSENVSGFRVAYGAPTTGSARDVIVSVYDGAAISR
jgi:hypothetical protein